ncbi:ArsR/SmtB family transcription factor [Nakamurella multipartita]|uniref:Transcriptional regulator, ArsR family n=1 Tax=Nakamurella multipartita (strain ATCC 700099 / DSM 44233 / CIP 104796 / JCM 9543 / NBRC 105858 / Y-104) TaxID=479431 RepID=C8XBE9_NAKMY|nr:transcriptional regulator, ArsR family [Nakamurella multipartita DSM 44233]
MVSETTWAALADPHRRAVLDLLSTGEHAVNDVVERLQLTQPQASKHLRVLREANLVQVRKDAQRRLYRLDPRPMAEIDAWLAPYRRRWNHSLDRLEDHLEESS